MKFKGKHLVLGSVSLGMLIASFSLLFNKDNNKYIETNASTAKAPIAEYYFNNGNPGYEVNQKHYLTKVGNPTSTGTSGIKGWVTFDGVDDSLVSTGFSSGTTPTDPFYVYGSSDVSIAFEMRVESLGSSWGFPLTIYEGGDLWHLRKGYVGFLVDPSGNLRFGDYAYTYVDDSSPDNTWWTDVITPLSAGTTYNIVISIDKDGKTNVYVDGVNKYSKNTAFNDYRRAGSDWSLFQIGGYNWTGGSFNLSSGGTGYCNYSFRNLNIYDFALNTKEVSEFAEYCKLLDHIQPAYVFNNNMILQRDTKVKIYGWDGTVGRTVNVSFNGQSKNASPAANGYWCAVLDAMPANSTGKTLTISDGVDTFNFTNVKVGEVWYAGGQSNMEWSFGEFLINRGYDSATVWGGGVDITQTDFKDYLNYTNYSKIAIYKQDYLPSDTPSKLGKRNSYMANGWTVPTGFNSVLGFSAYATGFVLRLQEGLGDVPVGLVLSSYRGSSVEEWISASTWSAFNLHSHYEGKGKEKHVLYNGMEYPLKDFQVAGLLWYQGCADSGYGDETQTWVNDWGNDMVALASQFRSTHGSNAAIICQQLVQHDDWVPWQFIRQKAWDLMDRIDNFYTVAGIGSGLMFQKQLPDIGNFIHPADKYGISRDAGNIALTNVYEKPGYNSLAQYPQKAYVTSTGTVIEYDKNAELFLKSGSAVTNLSGYNNTNNSWESIANATVSGNKIIVPSNIYTAFAYGQYNLMYPGAKSDPTNAKWKGYSMHPSFNSDAEINLYSHEVNSDLAVAPFSYIGVKPDTDLVENSTLLSTVAYISDTHWRDGNAYGDTFVKSVVSDINSLASSGTTFDAVINLGDLSENGVDATKTGYNSLAKWYEYVATNPVKNKNSSAVPFYSILGNHDVRGDSSSGLSAAERQDNFVIAAHLYQQKEIYNGWGTDQIVSGTYGTNQVAPDLLYYTTIGGFHYVFMNTYQCEWDACRLTPENLEWIDNTLTTLEAQDGNKPIFLLNHQPLDMENNSVYVVGDSTGFAFQEMLSRHSTTVYCSGHTHRPFGENHIFQDVEIGGYKIANYFNMPSLEHNGYADYDAYGVDGYTKRSVSDYTNTQYYVCEIYENGVIFKARDAQNSSWVGSSYMVINNKGQVTFKDDDESIISSKQYKYGENIDVEEVPTRDGYSSSWDKAINPVCNGDATYVATYTPNKYPVTFNNPQYGTSFLSTNMNATSGETSGSTFDYGSTVYRFVTIPNDTAQYSYSAPSGATLISGNTYRIDSLVVGLSGNAFSDISVSRNVNNYSVNFEDNTYVKNTFTSTDPLATSGHGSGYEYAFGSTVYQFVTLEDDTAQYEYSAKTGWVLISDRTYRIDSLTVGVNNNFETVSASRSTKSYNVNWYDENGANIVRTDVVQYGNVPSYGEAPTKEDYNFVGWSDEVHGEVISSLPSVTGEANYYPIFVIKDSYTITFKDQNNEIVDTVVVIEGHVPSTSVVPTKDSDAQYDYVFDGWSLTNGGDKLDSLPVVTSEATYYAHYNSVIRSYTITFKNYDDTVLDTANINYGEQVTYDGATPTKDSDVQYNYTFNGWDHTLGIVTGDDTFVATFTPSIRTYVVNFNLSGKEGVVPDNQDIDYGNKVNRPTDPKTTGYVLEGWYSDNTLNNKWDFANNTISGDLTLYAKWEEVVINVSSSQALAINYSTQSQILVTEEATVNKDLDLLYSIDSDSVANGFSIEDNVLSTPQNKDVNVYTIVITILEPNSQVEAVTTLTLTINKIDPSYVAPTVIADISYDGTAKALINAGNTSEGTMLYSLDGDNYSEDIPNATGIGNYNVYWKINGDSNHNDVAPNILVATIHNVARNYRVNHYKEGLDGNYPLADSELLEGYVLEETNAEAKDYTGFNAKPFSQEVIKLDGLTVVDIYYDRETYTVTLVNNNGEENVVLENIKYGTSAEDLYDNELVPTKTGYTFDGWYLEDYKVLSTDVIENNLILNARYNANIYAISLITNGGTIVSGNIDSYTYGEGATLPIDVNKENATFDGWYDNEEFEGDVILNIGATELGDKTFYAKWTEVPSVKEYTITYVTNGGTITEGKVDKYIEGEGAVLPTEVNRESYTFEGWYDNAQFDGDKILNIKSTDSGDKTFYAKWSEEIIIHEYTITYNTNGGTITEGKVDKYIEGEGAVLPTKVTKDGYTFEGWYDNAQFTGNKVVNIKSTDSGDKTFYAKWSKNSVVYTVTIYDSENGSIDVDKPQFMSDETVTITITPNSGYKLETLLINGTDFTDNVIDNALEITIDANISIEATFTKTSSEGGIGCASNINSVSLLVASLALVTLLAFVIRKRMAYKR